MSDTGAIHGLCDARRSTLVIIDLQEKLMPAIHEGGEVVKNAVMLAKGARMLGVPVVASAQYPQGLGPNVAEVQALCDKIFDKTDFDACAEGAFLEALTEERGDLIVAGCEAHVCVLQTVLGLRERGRKVWLVADAVGSRQPFSKAIALERMKAAGATLVTAEMVMFEWMRSSRHPHFKEMSRLLK